jgi:hypothetical protein
MGAASRLLPVGRLFLKRGLLRPATVGMIARCRVAPMAGSRNSNASASNGYKGRPYDTMFQFRSGQSARGNDREASHIGQLP